MKRTTIKSRQVSTDTCHYWWIGLVQCSHWLLGGITSTCNIINFLEKQSASRHVFGMALMREFFTVAFAYSDLVVGPGLRTYE